MVGDHSGEAIPKPIPNLEVKLSCGVVSTGFAAGNTRTLLAIIIKRVRSGGWRLGHRFYTIFRKFLYFTRIYVL